MVTVSQRDIFPLLVPILVPTAFPMLALNPIQSAENTSFLLATAAPTERLAPPVTWLDDLEHRLTTYFTKKYPAYDFSLYTHELSLILDAARLGDRWGANARMGAIWIC